MTNAKILQLLNDNKIDELKQAIIQEMQQAKTPNKDTYKAIVKLSRIAQKEGTKNHRPNLAGAYILGDEQNICNGYWALQTKNIYDGLYNIDEKIPNENKMNLSNIFKNTGDADKVFKPTAKQIQEIKNNLKIRQAESKKNIYVIKFDDTYINAEYFLNMQDCFNDNYIIYLFEHTKNSMIQIHDADEKTRAIILPRQSFDNESRADAEASTIFKFTSN